MKSPTPDEIRAYRTKLELTVDEAASVVHVAQRTWHAWEKGTNRMPPGLWELACIKEPALRCELDAGRAAAQ